MTRLPRHVLAIAWVAFGVILLAERAPAEAQRSGVINPSDVTEWSYQCDGFNGTYAVTPNWTAEPDALTGQVLNIAYRADRTPSNVSWSRNGEPYSLESGAGIPMATGWVVLVVTDDRVETYVFNGSTQELLFTQTRSGNSVLPNAVKAYRGVCRGAKGHSK